MTREEAKANLQALGLEEPTANQITNYLNQFHAGMPKQEPKTEPAQPKTEPKTVDWKETDEYKALQKQIEDMKAEGIKKDIKAYAAEKGLTGEQAEKILSAFQTDIESAKGAIDAMSSIIADKEIAAAQAKEQEIANGSTNPGGGNNAGGEKEKTEAEKIAESIGKTISESNKAASDVLETYI